MIKNILNIEVEFLNNDKQKWFFIVLCGVFSTLFLFLFKPYNINNWLVPENVSTSFIYSGFGITGMVTLFFTQFILRKFLKIDKYKLYQLLLWFLMDSLIITLAILVLFDLGDKNRFMMDILLSSKYISLILAFPYGLTFLFMEATKPKVIIKEEIESTPFIAFKDENGKTKLSIQKSDLLFIESSDNYITVNFYKEGRVKKEMIRNTLKNIELQFEKEDIYRCHRSFMFNKQHIIECQPKKNGLDLTVRYMDSFKIPVSRSYAKEVQEILER